MGLFFQSRRPLGLSNQEKEGNNTLLERFVGSQLRYLQTHIHEIHTHALWQAFQRIVINFQI